jgi:hypothetical protein
MARVSGRIRSRRGGDHAGRHRPEHAVLDPQLLSPIPVADAHELVWISGASTGDKRARELHASDVWTRAAEGVVTG